jgi:hypothetical protein
MVTVLAIVIPILLFMLSVAGIQAYRCYKRVPSPPPMVVGLIVPEVSPVRAPAILRVHDESSGEEPETWRLRRAERIRYFRLNMGHLTQEEKNTIMFLRALLFEKLQIKKNKSGFKYESVDLAVLALINEAVKIRWMQVRCRIIANLRVLFGLRVDVQAFRAQLGGYKWLEKHFMILVKSQDEGLHLMLAERLGIAHMVIVDGADEPAGA